MQKRFQVFVSSTFKDLEKEREEVMKTLLKFKCFPAGMELFPASGESQLEYILPIIDESDFCIIIIAGKYGTVNNEGLSYTEIEFDYAVKKKKTILAFIHKDINLLSGDKVETDTIKRKKLLRFTEKVKNERLVNLWENKYELTGQVGLTISSTIQNHPSSGWVKFSEMNEEYRKKETAIDFDEVKNIKEKTIYYKMLNLESIEENSPIIYNKYIPRLNKKIKVFSEYMTIRIIKFNDIVSNFKGRDRTNGDAIEVNSFLPYLLNLDDGDIRSNLIEPVINGPSETYVTSGHIYNGFKEGDFDLGLKAEKNTEIVRLILDFTSIKSYLKLFPSPPRLFYNRFIIDQETNLEKLEDLELLNYEIFSNGFFVAKMRNIRKNEGLRFEFAKDIENISNLS